MAGVSDPSELPASTRASYDEVHQDLVQASINYDATVEGIKDLKKRITDVRRAGNNTLAEKLETRLEKAKNLREQRKQAYRDSESIKVTARYNANLQHQMDEEEMHRQIIGDIGDEAPVGSDEYHIRERETVNSMYRTYSQSLKSAQLLTGQARQNLAKTVDEGTYHIESPAADRFRDAYENLYRFEHRRDSLKQIRLRLDSGRHWDGTPR